MEGIKRVFESGGILNPSQIFYADLRFFLPLGIFVRQEFAGLKEVLPFDFCDLPVKGGHSSIGSSVAEGDVPNFRLRQSPAHALHV